MNTIFINKANKYSIVIAFIIICILIVNGFLKIQNGFEKYNSTTSDDFFRFQWRNAFFYIDIIVSIIYMLTSLPIIIFALSTHRSLKYGYILSSIYGVFGLTMNLINKSSFIEISPFILCLLMALLSYIGWKKTKYNMRDNKKNTEEVIKLSLKFILGFNLLIFIIVLMYVLISGYKYMSLDILTLRYPSYDEIAKNLPNGIFPGGLADQIIGQIIIVVYSAVISCSLGLAASIYLSEYAPNNRITNIIKIFIDTLAGIPSILLGLLGLTLFVNRLNLDYSLASVGTTLSFMMLPWIIRVCEEALRSVPETYREASLALGVSKWKTIQNVVIGPAMPGIITAFLLGIGKAVGETTILFVTGGVTEFLPEPLKFSGPRAQMPSITVWLWMTRNGYSTVPSFELYSLVFTGGIILLAFFLLVSITGFLIRGYYSKKYSRN